MGRSTFDATTRPGPSAPGLSTEQAAARWERDGPNTVPPAPPLPLWRRVGSQLRDPLILVLLVAAALTAGTGDWPDMGVILLVIVINTTVGVAQEVRADRAVAALGALAAPAARVVRDGVERSLPAAGLVVGDLVVLGEGDVVPADADLTEAAGLLVDESALTGESVPVDKAPARDAALSAGTVVVKGRGRAVVTATGADAATGRIAAMLAPVSALTPLQRRLADVGKLLAAAAIVLSAVVLALGLARGQSAELMVVAAISLVVAAVPESLPAVVTLALALGARRMAGREALVRRLPAVETLGSVTVLATDKTGTLTEGRMAVRRLWTPEGGTEGEIEGRTEGGTEGGTETAGAGPSPALAALLTAAVLCNDATLRHGDEGTEETALGDPTETALLSTAAAAGLDRDVLRSRTPRIAEHPFDSDRKRMTTVHRNDDGTVRVICKGAPEIVLTRRIVDADPVLLHRAAEQAEQWARDGLRVLAVAGVEARSRPTVEADEGAHPGSGPSANADTDTHADADAADHDERHLRLLGLIGLADPPRPAAAATVAACRRAGIRPVLITGDHPGTARAVAAEVGILTPDAATAPVVDCREGLTEEQAATGSVFARATPADKLTIVKALRSRGDVVAMTGDGVNDGPALRAADIGVAMGGRGTEVARQAADLVLADDDLDTVVAAVEEGRRVFANIRRFLAYALAGGAAEIIVMLLGPALGFPLLLLPAQILWINLLTHGLPGVALGGEPPEPGAMERPPRPPAQSILGAGLWQRVVRVSLVLSAVTLGVAVWGHHTGRPWQSMAFFALGTAQLGVAIASRARTGGRANPLLPVAVAAALGLQVAALYVPVLRNLLSTTPLSAMELVTVTAVSTLGFAAMAADRRLRPAPGPPGNQGLSTRRRRDQVV
ncbi:cation-transporting P-type ATPase [Catenulispora subtropica]|uniref:HAD-IC family P-type ATPase n=1 Tax=Catenulispora subtropica TaxID=450798 RepID=A0ABN2TAJ7_9ACTN